MKKILTTLIVLTTITLFANPPPPRGGFGGGRGPQPAPHHGGYHHDHHHGWGKGGENFWPGFISGVTMGALLQPKPVIVTTPAVVPPVVQTQTIVVQQPRTVWQDGHYEIQNINGILTRVWVPGRYITIP